MKIHTGEKPYTFSNCDRSFGYKCHLKCHMRTHTREKSYLCSNYGRGFIQKKYLRHHMRIHTGEKLYTCRSCSICGRGFIKKFNLKNPAPYVPWGSKYVPPDRPSENKYPPLWIGEHAPLKTSGPPGRKF